MYNAQQIKEMNGRHDGEACLLFCITDEHISRGNASKGRMGMESLNVSSIEITDGWVVEIIDGWGAY